MKDTKIIGKLEHPIHMVNVDYVFNFKSTYCVVEHPEGKIKIPKDLKYPILFVLRASPVNKMLSTLFRRPFTINKFIEDVVPKFLDNAYKNNGDITSSVLADVMPLVYEWFINYHENESTDYSYDRLVHLDEIFMNTLDCEIKRMSARDIVHHLNITDSDLANLK